MVLEHRPNAIQYLDLHLFTKMSYLSDFKCTKSKTLRTATRQMTNWTKLPCDPILSFAKCITSSQPQSVIHWFMLAPWKEVSKSLVNVRHMVEDGQPFLCQEFLIPIAACSTPVQVVGYRSCPLPYTFKSVLLPCSSEFLVDSCKQVQCSWLFLSQLWKRKVNS